MTQEQPSGFTTSQLRLLSDDEMEKGFSDIDRALMAYQTIYLQLQREIRKFCLCGQKLQQAAERAAEKRLAQGAPAYVKIEGVDGIVRQMPDGTREIVEIIDGQVVATGQMPHDAVDRHQKLT